MLALSTAVLAQQLLTVRKGAHTPPALLLVWLLHHAVAWD